MTPQKQTVYLPVGYYHSSERAVCTIGLHDLYGDKVVEEEGYFFTQEQLDSYKVDIIKAAMADTKSMVICSNAGYESKIAELEKEVERLKFNRNQLLSDVIKDALSTAAEESLINPKNHDGYSYGSQNSIDIEPNENSYYFNLGGSVEVDKESITNTFNQIFNKHKV